MSKLLEINRYDRDKARILMIVFLTLGVLLPIILVLSVALFIRRKNKIKNKQELELQNFEVLPTFFRNDSPNKVNLELKNDAENKGRVVFAESVDYPVQTNIFQEYRPKKPIRSKPQGKSDENRLSVIMENQDEIPNLEIENITDIQSPKNSTSIHHLEKPKDEKNQSSMRILTIAATQNSDAYSKNHIEIYPYSEINKGKEVDHRGLPVKNALVQMVHQKPKVISLESLEMEVQTTEEKEKETDSVENRRKKYLETHRREEPSNISMVNSTEKEGYSLFKKDHSQSDKKGFIFNNDILKTSRESIVQPTTQSSQKTSIVKPRIPSPKKEAINYKQTYFFPEREGSNEIKSSTNTALVPKDSGSRFLYKGIIEIPIAKASKPASVISSLDENKFKRNESIIYEDISETITKNKIKNDSKKKKVPTATLR